MMASRIVRLMLWGVCGLLLVCAVHGCGRIGYDPLASGVANGGNGGHVGAGGIAGAGRDSGSDNASGTGGVVGAGGAAGAGLGAGGVPGTGGVGSGGAIGLGGATGTGGGGIANDAGTITCYPRIYAGHQYQFCGPAQVWPTAQNECQARGLRLTRIDDAAENSWMVMTALSSEFMLMTADNLWIGAHKSTAESSWRWMDGTAFWQGDNAGAPVNGLYSSWGQNEPGASSTAEACAAISLNGTTWIDLPCSRRQYFACELYP